VPFTGSHPAAVLPLLRTGLPASALVIGSVAPDLPYFVPVRVGGLHPPTDLGGPTHTLPAVVSLDLVLGLAAWALWHGVLVAPLLAAAPAGLAARLAGRVEVGLRRRLGPPAQVLRVALAVAVGAATHVVWDEFTHAGRWGATAVPALSATWAGLEGYRWAQYAGGVLGALALAVWCLAWWRRTAPDRAVVPAPSPRWPVWLAVLGPAAAIGAAAALSAGSVRSAAFRGVTVGGGAALVLLLVAALVWHVRERTGDRPRPS
jgi:hypothetical protein